MSPQNTKLRFGTQMFQPNINFCLSTKYGDISEEKRFFSTGSRLIQTGSKVEKASSRKKRKGYEQRERERE